MTNLYEIGGVCVRMSHDRAERWNSGSWTEEDDQTAMVYVPDVYEQGSRVVNGEVVMGGSRLVKPSMAIPMAEAYQYLPALNEGFQANFIE